MHIGECFMLNNFSKQKELHKREEDVWDCKGDMRLSSKLVKIVISLPPKDNLAFQGWMATQFTHIRGEKRTTSWVVAFHKGNFLQWLLQWWFYFQFKLYR